MQTCYRHSSVETGVSCSSCGRPICPDCMTPTPVGMRCPECSKQKTKVQTPRSIAGGDPRVTYALIAINIAVFAFQVLDSGGVTDPRDSWVYQQGVLFGPFVDAGDWWRLVTSGFLHRDPAHLLLNMVGLFFLGHLLEPRLGAVRYLALYFASLLAGSLGVMLLSPESYTIGASGAVFGLMGAVFYLLRRQGVDPMRTAIGPILIINVLFTFAYSATISVGGHLGGLAGGLLAAFLLAEAEHRRRAVLGTIGCVVMAVAAAVGAVMASGTPSLYP
jgi:membrane associated rhomboid family serine protease